MPDSPPTCQDLAHVGHAAPDSATPAAASETQTESAQLSVQRFRGCIALVGTQIDDLAREYLASSCIPPNMTRCTAFHITLFTKAELQGHALPADYESINLSGPILPLGVGGDRGKGVFFMACLWPEGQRFRLRAGLPIKDFHITLSLADAHDLNKGPDSVFAGSAPSTPTPAQFDNLSHHFLLCNLPHRSSDVALALCESDPASPRGWLRLADSALQLGQHKLAMLAYARTLRDPALVQDKLLSYCLKRLFGCAHHTEWGPLVTHSELSQIPPALTQHLVAPWPSHVQRAVRENIPEAFAPTFCLESRERLWLPAAAPAESPYELARFFRWVVPFHLAGMSTPRHADDLARLASSHIGIRHVLTLTEESPLPKEWFHAVPHLGHTFLPVPNYMPPTLEQIDLFLSLATAPASTPLLVHCGGGKGRAGTLLACYLVAFGFRPPTDTWTHPAMSAGQAIAALRAIRPGSLETEQQERAVRDFEAVLWKRQSPFPAAVREPSPSTPIVHGDRDLSHADLVVLCGLPGSGKTWFRSALSHRDASWETLSGDELGRNACESGMGARRPGGKLILDRCNGTAEDRKHFLKLASTWASHPIAVVFDYPTELCEYRAQRRPDHPTLPIGSRVRSAMRQHAREFTPPSLSEGFKAVVHVTSFEASWAVVLRLSAPVTLFKFPRTSHLLNLGAATRDDLVEAALPHIPAGASVLVTEKVDGANMGFSLSADGSLLVQNRSHYVTPGSHTQFKHLGAFVEEHREALHKMLFRDCLFPERFILFGEWMAARHSIHYTKLPQRFLAFDMYDRLEKSFLDRRGLEALLEGSGIALVPVVERRDSMLTEVQLRQLVQQRSQFWDGPVEGVYLKVEGEGRVLQRGKVVRADFIAGNEHWTRGKIDFNIVESCSADVK